MATRFTAKSGGRKGTVYTLEIDDSDFGGSNTDIEIQGFTLTYDPDKQEDPATSIIASSCTFNIVIRPSTQSAINTFIDDLESADEGRFRIKVTDSGSSIFWLGFILTDQVSIEDQDWADIVSIFQIRAVDGISRLKDLDYNDAGTAYTGRVLAKEHLFNVLDKIGLDDFYGGTDNYLFTFLRWYENSMGAAVTDDPLSDTYISHKAFISKDDKGNETFESCYDVLKQLAQLFLCRFYYSNGVYRLDQISEYRESTVTRHYYYKDGTKASANTGQDLGIVENSDDIIRLGNVNARYFYFAPAREITLTYKHFNDRNYLDGVVFDDNTDAEVNIGFNGGSGVRFWIRGTITHEVNFSPVTDFEKGYFLFQFKIRVVVSGTTYYLRRDYTINNNGVLSYDEMEWITTPGSVFYFICNRNEFNSPNAMTTDVDFETPDLPGGGEFTGAYFDFEYDEYFSLPPGQGQNTLSPASVTWSYPPVWQLTSDDDSALTESSGFTKTNADTPNASLTLEYETLIGDSPGTFLTSSSLSVDNAGTEEVSSEWAKGVGGGGKKLQLLWLDELMKLRTKSLKRYEGQITGTDYLPHNLLELISGERYVMQRLTYDSKNETWTGDWWFTGFSDSLTGTLGPVFNIPPVAGLEEPPGTGTIKIFNPIAGDSSFVDPIVQAFPSGGGLGAVTDGAVVGGSPTTTIPIEAIGSDCVIADGDEIQVIDPTTGNTYNFTVDGNVSGTDTSITVDSDTPTDSFPVGSYVALPVGTLVSNIVACATKTRYSQTFTSTGSQDLTVTVNSGNLPSNTAQIEVYYASQPIFETDDWDLGGGSLIRLNFTPEVGVKIRVFFWY